MSYAKEIIKAKVITPDIPDDELEAWYGKLDQTHDLEDGWASDINHHSS